MKRLLTLAITSLLGLLALPGTAFASPAPAPHLSGPGATGSASVIVERIVSDTSAPMWHFAMVALIAGLVAGLLVIGFLWLTRTAGRVHVRPA